MAAQRGGGPGSSRPAAASNHSVSVVVGASQPSGSSDLVLRQIEAGVRCWQVDSDVPVSDQQSKLFVSRHSAFSSEDVPGQRTSRHRGEVSDTQVVVNPVHSFVCSEVQRLLCDPSRHKSSVSAGQSSEAGGESVSQQGCFSFRDSSQISADEQVEESSSSADPASKVHLTLCGPVRDLWKDPESSQRPSQDLIDLRIHPDPVSPEMEGSQEFTEYSSECSEPDSPFDSSEPPGAVGFSKSSRPCCYVFPGGRGDSAFFAVNGFNVSVNGGSDPRSCFWKSVRHSDRIDSVLSTHPGADNSPGLNASSSRKSAERDQEAAGSDPEEDRAKRLVSPEVGVVFFNAPDRLKSVEPEPGRSQSCDQAALALSNSQKLGVRPEPSSRPNGATVEPVISFQKMGVGRSESYVLNPVRKDSEASMQQWPNGSSAGADLPSTCSASVCASSVWHPAGPQEKIVRVLFPGCTPQNKVSDGSEKLSHSDFLKQPSVSSEELESSKTQKPSKREASRESLKSQSKEPRPNGALQKDKRVEICKPESKTKTAPKEAEDKTKTKEVDSKAKPTKAAEKMDPKRDGPKEKRKDDKVPAAPGKKEDVLERKREAPRKDVTSSKTKKEAKPEPRRDIKKEGRTEEKKPAKLPVKEAKKTGGTVTDQRKVSAKVGNVKKDGTLPKKDVLNKETKAKTKEPQKEAKSPSPEETNGNQTPTTESPERFRSVETDQNPAGAASRPRGDLSVNFDSDPVPENSPRTRAEKKTSEPVSLVDSGPNNTGHAPFDGFLGDDRGGPGARRSGPGHEDSNSDVGSSRDGSDDSASSQDKRSSPARDPMPDSAPSPMATDSAPSLMATDSAPSPMATDSAPSHMATDSAPSPMATDSAPSPMATDSAPSPMATGPAPSLMTTGSAPSPIPTGSAPSPMATDSAPSPMATDSAPSPIPTGSAPSPIPTGSAPSMPAEVGSPHSTEVDCSFSVSSERLPSSRLCSDGGPPFPVGSAHNGHPGSGENVHGVSELSVDVPHDVDLCSVSPCEFQHHRTSEDRVSPDSSQNQSGSQETPPTSTSVSLPSATDSDVPPSTEDCPSITADSDSDEEDSGLFRQDASGQLFIRAPGAMTAAEPPPAPVKDSPPSPFQRGACMADPEAERSSKTSSAARRKPSQRTASGSSSVQSGRSKAGSSGSSKTAVDAKPSSRGSLAGSRVGPTRPAGSRPPASAASEAAVVYVDSAYSPSGSASSTVDQDSFRRSRSSYYIISGDEPVKEAMMRSILDGSSEGKSCWADVPVTLIPTFDSMAMHEWYQETHERQRESTSTVLGSNSTVAMQDETFPACKVEF